MLRSLACCRRCRQACGGLTGRTKVRLAFAAVVTGGTRLGMMIARAKCWLVCGTTCCIMGPSLTCRCMSSGCVMVMLPGALAAVLCSLWTMLRASALLRDARQCLRQLDSIESRAGC